MLGYEPLNGRPGRRVGVQPIGRILSPHPRTLTCIQTATRRPGLPFNGLVSTRHGKSYRAVSIISAKVNLSLKWH